MPALLTFSLMAAAFFVTADFKGVEINIEQNKIREYQHTLLGKKGDWMNYQHFSRITLKPSHLRNPHRGSI